MHAVPQPPSLLTVHGTHRRLLPLLIAALAFAAATVGPAPGQEVCFLSDRQAGPLLRHQQQWGEFGIDTAAARPGGVGSPLQIGQTTFQRGLGHHANGEIVVDLQGRYRAFRAAVGVQWQGGQRGSVIFRVVVDGQVRFETGPMSDSDPPRDVDVPLEQARELRLIAMDAGDGFGCDMANWVNASLLIDPQAPRWGPSQVVLSGPGELLPAAAAGGFTVIARTGGPQVAAMETAGMYTASVAAGEEVRWVIPVKNLNQAVQVQAEVTGIQGSQAQVEISLGGQTVAHTIRGGQSRVLTTGAQPAGGTTEILMTTRGLDTPSGVRWSRLECTLAGGKTEIPLQLPAVPEILPPPESPPLAPAIEQQLIEWDWRMQDGIGTRREPQTWQQATERLIERGQALVEHLTSAGVELPAMTGQWETLREQYQQLCSADAASQAPWEALWREVHQLRRRIALQNPLARVGPLLFTKRVPSSFSHQLTQYAGRCARPGGGLFVLDSPGESMLCRRLADLPTGSYLHPEVSWDGKRVLFAFCQTDPGQPDWRSNDEQFYHLWEVAADGSGLRQLTSGPYDDFAPRYLPDGKLLFLSTRRGGFHRCGRGPCPVHTLAVAEADGSDPRVISFHETHEWDPAVLHDGRILYTRWDYVDRHAVFYQQLWSARPDGSDVRAFYGNNTLNPVGVWEARPVPGSTRVMATAAAHHAMTAGSIILLDVTRGIDGLEPITRLTPDVLFPESESPVGSWRAPAGVPIPPQVPVEERRWPGHCYRTPLPLSEDFFLVAYSFEPLIGEPYANRANMFGIYLADRYGNKELLYRDPSIGSLWPIPLRPRVCPPAIASELAATDSGEGTFFLQDVYASWPEVSRDEPIQQLRIVQVLPKTTPNANSPRVGLANASPGKQVLGTVPVEPDGSAYFRAPAGIPLSFQALDRQGMAVQTMRSLTYLQPGEQSGCVGCHEHRTTAPATRGAALAGQRPPSAIRPAPEGAKPFNYALLVQPVLDQHCVECHREGKADGGVDLTGTPAGEFTASYLALAPRVPFSEWKGTPAANAEPLTPPDRFGARASPLMKLLLEGHENVILSAAEIERLVTWMDANALFYGTFDPEAQQRQRRGEQIAGPALE